MNDEEKLTIDDLKKIAEDNNLSQLSGLGSMGQAMIVGTPGNILPGGGSIQGIWRGLNTSPYNTNHPSYPNTLPDYMLTQVDLSVEEIKEELDQLGKRMMELRDMLERKMDIPPEKIERRKVL
jgi:hypothetical protein